MSVMREVCLRGNRLCQQWHDAGVAVSRVFAFLAATFSVSVAADVVKFDKNSEVESSSTEFNDHAGSLGGMTSKRNRREGIRSPEHLTSDHKLSDFDSGVPALDDWLASRVFSNEQSGASRTYGVCAGSEVIGYYSLAAGAVACSEALGRVRRNMPDPIPVMILGRLAVDRKWQGRGIGQGMLRDAVIRTIQAADIAGMRALLVHAISEEAKRFYKSHGFSESSVSPMTLMIRISDAAKTLG